MKQKKKCYGIDISHWNSKQDIVRFMDSNDFVIMKATEGKTHVDPMCVRFTKTIEGFRKETGKNIISGYYHFASNPYNNAVEEAANFIRTVKIVRQDCESPFLLALDVEDKMLEFGTYYTSQVFDMWVCTFLEEVSKAFGGYKPLVYCSQSVVKYLSTTAYNGYGLWVARYNNNPGKAGIISPWTVHAIHQFTNSYNGLTLDGNIFNGSIEQLLKYCVQEVPHE